MKIAKFVLPVIAAGFVASSAQAAVVYTNTIDTSNPSWVVNTITVDTGIYDMTAFSAKLTLASGTINQEPLFPGADPNDPSFWSQPGASGLDSYITMNGNPPSTITGGGTPVGGGAVAVFDFLDMDLTWGNNVGGETGAGQVIARIVLSPDAQGTFAMLGADSSMGLGDPPFPAELLTVVENGAIVPEPASLALLGLGGLAVLRRR